MFLLAQGSGSLASHASFQKAGAASTNPNPHSRAFPGLASSVHGAVARLVISTWIELMGHRQRGCSQLPLQSWVTPTAGVRTPSSEPPDLPRACRRTQSEALGAWNPADGQRERVKTVHFFPAAKVLFFRTCLWVAQTLFVRSKQVSSPPIQLSSCALDHS